MGRQIHKAKYSDAPEHEKEAAADEIAGRLMGFIAEVYEDPGLPFSVCVAPPSHQQKEFELAHYLCNQVAVGFNLIDASQHLREKKSVTSMKEISDFENRLERLTDALTVDPPTTSSTPRGFLIIDDVFDTGATTTAICKVFKEWFPRSQFHILAGACLRG